MVPGKPPKGVPLGEVTEGVTNLDGKEVVLADYVGQVVLLNFWATWCPPCVREIPDLQSLHEKYKGQGVAIIGVTNDDPKAVRKFVQRKGVTYPILLDKGRLEFQFGVAALPTTFVFDRKGEIVAVYVGSRSAEELERDLKAALGRVGKGI